MERTNMTHLLERVNTMIKSDGCTSKILTTLIAVAMMAYAIRESAHMSHIKISDHRILLGLIMLLVIFISVTSKPTIALPIVIVLSLVAVSIASLSEKKRKNSKNIPDYEYDGHEGHVDIDPIDTYRKRDEIDFGKENSFIDPVGEVSDEEIKSLVQRHLTMGNVESGLLDTRGNFSGMSGSKNAYNFAKHQYQVQH